MSTEIHDLTGSPPIGGPTPEGTYWTGCIEFHDATSDDKLRALFAVARRSLQ